MFGHKKATGSGVVFAPSARNALREASNEAAGLQHEFVGTEHILLALLADRSVNAILTRVGVAPERVRTAVGEHVTVGTRMSPAGALPYTSRTKKALELAMAEARENGADAVESTHLLAGLLREERSLAAQVLTMLGVVAEDVRATIPRSRPQGSLPFSVRIDDSSARSIYEQIVAQITEGVATGVLHAGMRLPTVRKLADELDIAPGTVARAYAELEQQGLVITEGSRGTRVAGTAPPSAHAAARPVQLAAMLRPVAVAAFHLGGSAEELHAALDQAMRGIFDKSA